MKKSSPNGVVYLVGAGPGDAGLLTLRGAGLLARADVVVYDWLVSPEILKLAAHAQRIYVGKRSGTVGRDENYVRQSHTNELLAKLADQGKQVVRLKGGDPLIFARGGEEASYLRKRGIRFEIVPGVSAGTAVPAYAGIPLTDRRLSSAAVFVTAHEDPTKKSSAVNWESLAKLNATLVCFMGVKNLPRVSAALVRYGMKKNTPVSIIEWGTFPNQRVVEGTLATIAKQSAKAAIRSPSLIVIGEVNRLRRDLTWFGGAHARKRVVVTRPRAQMGHLRQALEARGAEVIEFPTIEILPPQNWRALDRELRRAADYDWIVFTSVNGVEYVMDRLECLGKDARLFLKSKIAAIGCVTAEALSKRGLRADLVPKTFTTDGLLQTLRRRAAIHSKNFLLLRADIAPDYLVKELRRDGAHVTQVTAYRTQPAGTAEERKNVLRLIDRDEVDYVTFTSASTVDNFFRLIPKAKRPKIKSKLVTIGPVTSAALKRYGHKPYREAHEQTIEGLVKAIKL